MSDWAIGTRDCSVCADRFIWSNPKESEPEKWHLIVDLSLPEGASMNDGISKELCSLSYVCVDDIVPVIQRLGQGTLLAKLDMCTMCLIIWMTTSLWAASSQQTVQKRLGKGFAVCSELGVPVAPHKCVGSLICTFYGIEVDAVALELQLPGEKLEKLRQLIACSAGQSGVHSSCPG